MVCAPLRPCALFCRVEDAPQSIAAFSRRCLALTAGCPIIKVDSQAARDKVNALGIETPSNEHGAMSVEMIRCPQTQGRFAMYQLIGAVAVVVGLTTYAVAQAPPYSPIPYYSPVPPCPSATSPFDTNPAEAR